MMRVFVFMILLAVITGGCGESKPDNVELVIKLDFPDQINCDTYLADHFLVTLYNSKQEKKPSKTFDCSSETEELVLYVEKDSYYITVALKDSNDLNNSYGSATVDMTQGDNEVTVEMAEYLGGITLKWNSSDCTNYGLNNLKVTLENDEGPVSSVIWGKKEKLENYEILCNAEMLEIVNIPSALYTSVINGFRTPESKRPRIVYTIDQFKTTTGQDKAVNINDHKEIVVSDLKIKWEFDSKSISDCESAGVGKVIASFISTGETITEEKFCDDRFETFYFYDIAPGEYEILLRGMNGNEETLFEGSLDKTIEKGYIGSDILSEEIYLVEK
jgi:hypothetical protein